MGIVKISESLHEQARIASKAMSRSINAQAEHWMKVGMLVEVNPTMTYSQACKMLLDDARQNDVATMVNIKKMA